MTLDPSARLEAMGQRFMATGQRLLNLPSRDAVPAALLRPVSDPALLLSNMLTPLVQWTLPGAASAMETRHTDATDYPISASGPTGIASPLPRPPGRAGVAGSAASAGGSFTPFPPSRTPRPAQAPSGIRGSNSQVGGPFTPGIGGPEVLAGETSPFSGRPVSHQDGRTGQEALTQETAYPVRDISGHPSLNARPASAIPTGPANHRPAALPVRNVTRSVGEFRRAPSGTTSPDSANNSLPWLTLAIPSLARTLNRWAGLNAAVIAEVENSPHQALDRVNIPPIKSPVEGRSPDSIDLGPVSTLTASDRRQPVEFFQDQTVPSASAGPTPVPAWSGTRDVPWGRPRQQSSPANSPGPTSEDLSNTSSWAASTSNGLRLARSASQIANLLQTNNAGSNPPGPVPPVFPEDPRRPLVGGIDLSLDPFRENVESRIIDGRPVPEVDLEELMEKLADRLELELIRTYGTSGR